MSHTLNHDGFTLFWYGVLVILTAVLFLMSMGGGVFGLDSSHVYHKLSMMTFESLCHQQPVRSISLNGVTMAVCSRCFGIYGSLFVGLVIFPMLITIGLPYRKRLSVIFIVLTLMMIIVDFTGNLAGAWMNSHQSRIILGVLFGASLAWLLAGEFKQKPNIQTHGTS